MDKEAAQFYSLLLHSGRKLSFPVTLGLEGEQSLQLPRVPLQHTALLLGPYLALKMERTGLRAAPVSSQFFLKILTLRMRVRGGDRYFWDRE